MVARFPRATNFRWGLCWPSIVDGGPSIGATCFVCWLAYPLMACCNCSVFSVIEASRSSRSCTWVCRLLLFSCNFLFLSSRTKTWFWISITSLCVKNKNQISHSDLFGIAKRKATQFCPIANYRTRNTLAKYIIFNDRKNLRNVEHSCKSLHNIFKTTLNPPFYSYFKWQNLKEKR